MSSWLQASWWQVVMGTAGPSFGYELGCFVLCVLLSFSSWPCLPVALPPRWALLSSTGPASSSLTVSACQWLFFVDLVLELSPSPVPLPTISWTISWTIPETDPKVTFTSIVLRKVGSIDWVCEHWMGPAPVSRSRVLLAFRGWVCWSSSLPRLLGCLALFGPPRRAASSTPALAAIEAQELYEEARNDIETWEIYDDGCITGRGHRARPGVNW